MLQLYLWIIIIFSLQCPFIDMPMQNTDSAMANDNLISNALKSLLGSITHRIEFLNENQLISDPSEFDIRYVYFIH